MSSPEPSKGPQDDEGIEEEDDVWDEDWGEVEGDACKSLFSDKMLPSITACCQYDAESFSFDFRAYRKQQHLNDYQTIKCINYIRACVRDGQDPLPTLQAGEQPYLDDKYFQPVLEDDAFLFHDFAEDQELGGEEHGGDGGLAGEVARLRDENEALREALHMLQSQAIPPELIGEVNEALDRTARCNSHPDASTSAPSTSAAPPPPAEAPSSSPRTKSKDVDEQYFDSYSYFDIHREMLEDRVRTCAYRDALEKNPKLVKGATVLDVGCGTGILAMFAARGGASRVVAVDGSERIASFALANVARNGFAAADGGPITVISGKVEEQESLPVGEHSVDVIVSEWMGYAMLFESMLDSVLYARDRWLKPGGCLLPDKAIFYLAAGDQHSTGLEFWDDVYGFSMQDIRSDIHKDIVKQALVSPVKPKHLMSAPAAVKEFDLVTMKREDVDFHAEFELKVERAGPCHSVVLWFDTPFSERYCSECPVVLSTSPHTTLTHWAQTVLVLASPLDLLAGSSLLGRLSFARSDQHRSLDISLELTPCGADGKRQDTIASSYVMSVGTGK